MTKENAHLYLPLLQALADGSTLQYKDITEEWTDILNVTLAGEPQDYRIKPEPRKWKVWVDSHGYLQSSGNLSKPPAGWIQIEVIEILPENNQ